ncbi:MAG: nitrile hydratase subunit alpha [Alphaproteobacteria bacterium]|nr:nitrile hydratase subunit alpha [Alphaproteobacteria bacterium]
MSGHTHHDHHDHDHDHPHPTQPDVDGPLTYHQRLEIAVRELMIEKGVLTADEVRRTVEAMDARSPAGGARVVARAWTDPAYKQTLMTDPSRALNQVGVEVGLYKLVVVENTDAVHNLVVCTLCSCYPRAILGLPPDWYKSRAYRSRAVREPRTVMAEFGLEIPDDVAVRVHDSTADMRYLVLPKRPKGTEGWSETRLAGIVTRDTMIGVAEARLP